MMPCETWSSLAIRRKTYYKAAFPWHIKYKIICFEEQSGCFLCCNSIIQKKRCSIWLSNLWISILWLRSKSSITKAENSWLPQKAMVWVLSILPRLKFKSHILSVYRDSKVIKKFRVTIPGVGSKWYLPRKGRCRAIRHSFTVRCMIYSEKMQM